MKLTLLLLLLAPLKLHATPLTGKLDWNYTDLSPVVEREVRNGQWLSGVEYLPWSLMHGSDTVMAVGIYTVWNSQTANNSYGLSVYVPISDMAAISKGVLTIFKIDPSFKVPGFVSFAGQALGLQVMGGYMPTWNQSVFGPFTYGVGAIFKVHFDAKGALQAGF